MTDFEAREIKDPMPAGRSTKKSEQLPIGQNRLVDSFGSADQKKFLSVSSKVELKLREILQEPGDEVEFCYFPLSGVLSIIALMSTGAGAEVGLLGCEGMMSVGVVLGDRKQRHQVLVQGNGESYRIASTDLMTILQDSEEAQAMLLRYANGFLNFVAQGAACNALHKAEARLARWILLVQDRMQRESLPITHEFIADMLGTRRATVTVVANQLEEAGLIQLGRREIKVLDREGLIHASCECYGPMRKAVTPPPPKI